MIYVIILESDCNKHAASTVACYGFILAAAASIKIVLWQ